MVTKTRPKCIFDGCENQSKALGLCMGHYHQRRGGRELAPLRGYRLNQDVERNGERLCNRCNEWKALDGFYRVQKNGPFRSECKRCFLDRLKERRGQG